jgi:hypothetical protein
MGRRVLIGDDGEEISSEEAVRQLDELARDLDLPSAPPAPDEG